MHPARPLVISTLSQHRDAGLVLISHCRTGKHSHVVDYALIDTLGDVVVDYAFKASRICPECGAPGGMMEIRHS
jgi:hypothetical protein